MVKGASREGWSERVLFHGSSRKKGFENLVEEDVTKREKEYEYKTLWNLLLTHVLRLKNTTKDWNVPAVVNCRWREEPTVVNYSGIHLQLTTDAILIQIQAEALSSIVIQSLSKFLKSLSKSL